jgi:hypothetical protein
MFEACSGGTGRNVLLAVFAVFPGNYQRAISRSPQKTWTSAQSAAEITASCLAVISLFFAVLRQNARGEGPWRRNCFGWSVDEIRMSLAIS